MESISKAKNVEKMVVTIIAIIFSGILLTSCSSSKRQISFNPMELHTIDENAKKVRIKDFNFEIILDIEPAKSFINNLDRKDAKEKLHNRLKLHLLAKNLIPVLDDDAQYDLSGKLIMREKHSYNGKVWLAQSFIILFPVGLFIHSAIPYRVLEDESTAAFILKDINSSETLAVKDFSKIEKAEAMSMYKLGNMRNPESEINQRLFRTADDVMRNLADEVAKLITNKSEINRLSRCLRSIY